MSKRRRTTQGQRPVFQISQKRPIDKSLVYVNKDTVDATQVTTQLLVATFPCTVTGLRWDIQVDRSAGTGQCRGDWCIVLVKDGNSANSISISDAATFYEPEQNVLAFGVHSGQQDGPDSTHFMGTTKTMRKLMGGDQLIFVYKGLATNTSNVRGIIQFFCKS